jgi:hypothetical protein
LKGIKDINKIVIRAGLFKVRARNHLSLVLFLIVIILFIISFNTTGVVGVNQNQDQENEVAYIEVSKFTERQTIFVYNSGETPVQTKVTINVKGKGLPGIDYNPQDVVFIMDNSDSMDENDNEYKRIESLKLYLERMIPPGDRAALVKFSKNAEIVNNHHLTSDYEQLISDLPALWHTTGLTNLGAAIAMANEELIEHGDPDNNTLVEILLTDGRPEPPENNVTIKTINEAIANNIKIYTVGLGKDHDAQLLRWISSQTGGKYYYAEEAEDLLEIYEELSSQFRNFTAGMDTDLKDSEPLLRDVLPDWINYIPGSFSKDPDYIGVSSNGGTVLEWNISGISIGETWSVSYNISSTRTGDFVLITDVDLARVKYFSQEDAVQVVRFSNYYIRVLPRFNHQYPGFSPPPPPPPPAIPPTPTSGFPLPAAPSATPVPVTATPILQATPGATPAAIPVQYLFAGFLGLGVLERIKHLRMIKSKQKVAMGV